MLDELLSVEHVERPLDIAGIERRHDGLRRDPQLRGRSGDAEILQVDRLARFDPYRPRQPDELGVTETHVLDDDGRLTDIAHLPVLDAYGVRRRGARTTASAPSRYRP